MTALDADTLRNLRADAQHIADNTNGGKIHVVADDLLALLDAAEAVERVNKARIRIITRLGGEPLDLDQIINMVDSDLRAALAPPPDPLAYTTHDDYDDEPPQ